MRNGQALHAGGTAAMAIVTVPAAAGALAAAPNTFSIAHDKDLAQAWDIHAPWSTAFQRLCDYHGKTLRALDRLLGPRGLAFHMSWDLDRAPATGRNVVVLLIGDERCQAPRYARDVLAVFKTGAVVPFHPYAGRRTRMALKATDAVRDVRDGVLRMKRARQTGPLAANVFALPLGYHQQVDLPLRPFGERTSDIFFAGGRGRPVRSWDVRSWQFRPRTLARSAMFTAVDQAVGAHPTWRCDVAPAKGDARFYDPEAYSAHLMNAKIALCPRGNFPETFRHFEAARAGAVIVTEPLPPTWYFKDLPAVVIDDWRDAPEALDGLLAAPERMAHLHEQTLAWWREVASPEALARTMAAQIETLSAATGGTSTA